MKPIATCEKPLRRASDFAAITPWISASAAPGYAPSAALGALRTFASFVTWSPTKRGFGPNACNASRANATKAGTSLAGSRAAGRYVNTSSTWNPAAVYSAMSRPTWSAGDDEAAPEKLA